MKCSRSEFECHCREIAALACRLRESFEYREAGGLGWNACCAIRELSHGMLANASTMLFMAERENINGGA